MSTVSSSSTVPAEFLAELSQQKLRTTAIELELAAVREQLRQLSGNAATLSTPTSGELATIAQITREVFGVEPEAGVLCEPTDPEHPFLVFTVPWQGEPDSLITNRRVWHERVRAIFSDPLNHPRLCVVSI